MKARVVKLLNIRYGSPELSAPIKGVLQPGFELDLISVVSGDSIAGNSKWYKGLNNEFYWSGALKEIG